MTKIHPQKRPLPDNCLIHKKARWGNHLTEHKGERIVTQVLCEAIYVIINGRFHKVTLILETC